MSGLDRWNKLILKMMRWAFDKQLVGGENSGFKREREFCRVCDTPIDYAFDGSWYNVDISRGQCSWSPFCEVVLCSRCVKEEKEKCVRVIMDLLR
jgi:hypothetical protein